MNTCRFYSNDSEDADRCAICQHDCRVGDELCAGPCNHALHRECAEEYVDNFRLDFPGERVRCPLCKSAEAFDPAMFPPRLAPEEEELEQHRRSEARREEQLHQDLQLAREIFFEDFGVHVVDRRRPLRRTDMDIFFWLQMPAGVYQARMPSPPPPVG
jgi:hypothetical protein